MSTDLTIKKGDTRDWRFVLSDTGTTALNLTSATVYFRLRKHEWGTINYFDRQSGSGGTNSDFINISDATNGIITITPRNSDYWQLSDCGIYIGEVKIIDSNNDTMFVKDVEINIQEAVF